MADIENYLRPGTLTLTRLPPLSLYVHFPWCVRKCPYCDFNSHELTAPIPEADYISALRADIESALPLIWGRRISSVFIGGGTPSLMSEAAVDRLLSDVRALLPLDAGCEITLEANPGTFEAQRFAAYRRSGVNRLSIGIQSFEPAKLAALGRIHDRCAALEAIEIARALFDNFNLDLMFALPDQTLAQARADVELALSLEPPHLSLYQLTLEPNTVFAKYPPPLPDEDLAGAMHDLNEERLAAAGYVHYEVSAWAKAGHQCRHNLNYWTFGDYLGVGAGAHSKLTFPHRIVRQVRFKQPASYLQAAASGLFVSSSSEIERAELPFEFMLNALRLTAGVRTDLFYERTGMPLSSVEVALDEAERRGLLQRTHVDLRPTALGRRFLNDLQTLFLPDAPKSGAKRTVEVHNAS